MFHAILISTDMTLEEEEPSVKGWNWGEVSFTGSSLSFLVDKKPAFEINLSTVSNSTHQKNEAIIEFHKVPEREREKEGERGKEKIKERKRERERERTHARERIDG